MYKSLKTIFHQSPDTANKTYKERFNSPYAVHLDIALKGGNAFFVVTPEIHKKMLDILRQDKLTHALTNQLPAIATSQYLKQCIIEEVTSTNDIEGVYSSRQDINKLIENLESQTSITKFLGLVKNYLYLTQKNNIKFTSCKDIRKAYDNLLLNDIINEDPKNKPDGVIFRKNSVSITNNGKEIHKGIIPEDKIIEYLEKSLKFFNDKNQDPLLRAAVFHYLFGYIHPFYDGNGRLNRFISCWMFTKEFEAIAGYCFSSTIKNNLNKYYKAFNTCNHVMNKGDLTPFVEFFIDAVFETFENLNENLKEKLEIYKNNRNLIKNLPYANQKKYLVIYDILLQATLFSEAGISTKDLLAITKTTRTTLRKRLNKLISEKIVSINKISNEKFYKLPEEKLSINNYFLTSI